jgi:GT2 family glycosyltransferase
VYRIDDLRAVAMYNVRGFPNIDMQPLVSVIIVNHNRASLLSQCLQSLLLQSFREFELLVVDNGSEDTSCALVSGLANRDSRVCLISLDKNLGFGGANNVGFSRSRGKLIALFNNDAVADARWLEHLVSAIGQRPEVGMCAGKILFYGTNVIDKAGHLIFPDGQNRGRGTGQIDEGQYDQPGETIFADGCAALYRRELIQQTGGFDEDFFAYADDADLGLRGRWLGWTSLYAPEAVVYHRHSSTSGCYSLQKIYWVERNRFWLAVKNLPLPLLLSMPGLTLYRWTWNLWAAVLGRGAAGNFRQQASARALLWCFLRAYKDALIGFPAMWRKRRQIMGTRRLGRGGFYALLFKYRIKARTLAFQDADLSIRRHAEMDGLEEPVFSEFR